MRYALEDKHSDAPHWDTAYPFKANPAVLPSNRQAVEAALRNTEARLAKEPLWNAAYEEQIHDQVSIAAAIKFTKEQIED